MTSCILSRLDFSNSFPTGTPNSIIQLLQTLPNSAERLVFRSRRTQHCKPLLCKLHWLPVTECIRFKVCCLSCFKVVSGSALVYLSKLLHTYTPFRTLRHHLIHVCSPQTATNESNMVSAVSPAMAPTPGMTFHMTSDTVTLSLLLKTD